MLDLNVLLYVTLIIYIVILSFAFTFKIKWLIMIAGLLWFIPLIEIDNMFIDIVSIIMFISHSMLGFLSNESEEWE